MVVGVGSLPDDDDFILDQVTEELADDLREVGEVERIPQAGRGAGDKGVAELVAGAVAVLATADPGYLQALADVIVGFLQRNTGRRAHLRVGDIEFTIDRPSRKETAELIKAVQTAIERHGDG
ncbi:hypothetical protein [Paractinoplanes ferrugineus]|nr:hypothetical protein [Actinoplanes ferrugineus]